MRRLSGCRCECWRLTITSKLKNVSIKEFLTTAQAGTASKLPWLHTTQSGHLADIIGTGSIAAMPCNVFEGEKLTYLFVGRPAYKYEMDPGETQEWLLPSVFVIRFPDKEPAIKRLYPFDSGAFSRQRFPRYVTFFKAGMYELDPDRESIGRVVSTFFGSDQAYWRRQAHSPEKFGEEHDLTPRHAAVKAVNLLYREKSSEKFDDRAAAIEVQLDTDILLSRQNLLGVVIPNEYKRDKQMMPILRALTQNIESYDHYPLNGTNYFSEIYSAVAKIYKKARIIL